ncbi:hypothetical protein OH809_23345 [Streptomyces sp. NBC_00873]|uniref:hypothetical protein n=1 Tax=unclassified Streptomyces TaxID=2593676 RepID=UPI0038650808|nr:hypothetical protein OH809_23345 [Streptomyces sp. NBC_00873]WTA44615.1 hypothetical protein OH821_19950 [Streptomyces sp. NBC_00842]
MRNFIETREIADNDLDNISGGISAGGGVYAGPIDVSGGVAVDGVEGLIGSTASLVPVPSAIAGL